MYFQFIWILILLLQNERYLGCYLRMCDEERGLLRGGAGEARLEVGMGLLRGVVGLVVGDEILSEEEGERGVWQVWRYGRSGQERREVVC